METSSPPPPAIDLSIPNYYQLVYTLTGLLPPPLEDTPEAPRARNNAAVAKVAALLPVNANEADLAAQCIAARAQAEDLLRLIRENADDIKLMMRLNAQYSSMVRTSLSVHARLMRVQALRHKREAIEGAANEDAWTQHVAEQAMLRVVEADAARLATASPQAAPVVPPDGTPAAYWGQNTRHSVSQDGINCHNTAFETRLSKQPGNQGSRRSGEMDVQAFVREAIARSHLVDWESPVNGRESPGTAD
jgi:hypothetical protein